MIGGNPRLTGALAESSTRPEVEVDEHPRPHLHLVRVPDEPALDDEPDAPEAVRPTPAPRSRTLDERHLGVITATVVPSVMVAVVAFAGHALALRDVGLELFGTLILIQAVAGALIGLGALGVPGLLRTAPSLTIDDAATTRRRLGRFQLVAIAIGAAGVAGSTSALTDVEMLASAGLFALAAAARVASTTDSALIERAGDYRAGAAAALGTSVIWLAALLACIETGFGSYALPIAAVGAELVRATWSWRRARAIDRMLHDDEWDDDVTAEPRRLGLGSSLLFLPTMAQGSLVAATALVVVGAFGTTTELGTVAIVAVVLRLVLMIAPVVDSVGPTVVHANPRAATGRIWQRAAKLSDALVVPVGVGAVAAFAIGTPAIAQATGVGGSTVALVAGLILMSAPATHIVQIADLALRSTGRHLVANAVVGLRLAIVAGIGTAGAIAFDGSAGFEGMIVVAAAWAAAEWLAAGVTIAITSWRPFDLPTLGALAVLVAVTAGLFAADGSSWDPPRIALASMLVVFLIATVPRAAAQLGRLDRTVAQNLSDRHELATT